MPITRENELIQQLNDAGVWARREVHENPTHRGIIGMEVLVLEFASGRTFRVAAPDDGFLDVREIED